MATALEIREVEKLSLSQAGLVEAYSRGLLLQEKGWMLYPAASWDEPAILAFVGEKCVAGVNWSVGKNDGRASVDFAWCSPDHPKALTACLLRFRKRLQEDPPTWLSFTSHRGNHPMEKLVSKLGLVPHSQSYRVPESFYRAKGEMRKVAQPNILARVWAAIKGVEAERNEAKWRQRSEGL